MLNHQNWLFYKQAMSLLCYDCSRADKLRENWKMKTKQIFYVCLRSLSDKKK